MYDIFYAIVYDGALHPLSIILRKKIVNKIEKEKK